MSEERIARLERQNRHLRIGVIAALILPVLLMCLMGAGSEVRTDKITVLGSRLSFVTDTGRVLAHIESQRNPFDATKESAHLCLYARQGSKVAQTLSLSACPVGGFLTTSGMDGRTGVRVGRRAVEVFGQEPTPEGIYFGRAVLTQKDGVGQLTLSRTDKTIAAELP